MEVQTILLDIGNFLAFMAGQLRDWMGRVIGDASSYLRFVTDGISRAVTSALGSVGNVLNGLGQAVQATVGPIITQVSQFLQAAYQDLIGSTDGLIRGIANFLNTGIASLQAAVSGIVDTVSGALAALRDGIVSLIASAMAGVADILTSIARTVSNAVSQLLSVIRDAYLKFTQDVQAATRKLFDGVDSTIGRLTSKIADLRTSLEDAAKEVVKGLRDISEEAREKLLENLNPAVEFFTSFSTPEDTTRAVVELRRMLEGQELAQGAYDNAAKLWDTVLGGSPVLAKLFFLVVGPFTMLQLFSGVASANAQILLQEFGRRVPFQVLPPADAIQAWRRGLMSADAAVYAVKSNGLSEKDADTLFRLAETVPPELDLITMWRRNVISDDVINSSLRQRGYSSDMIVNLKAASNAIPPVQDLIVMAVREVFSPEVAARFGQFDDYPETLTPWAKQNGLTEEWAKRYWAAHWNLPSPSMGFEMLHRGIIEKPDLELLLRSLDVMPFWRDRLIQLSYNVYTRVDIRRMHQAKVLTDVEVFQAHKELGYDDEKAKRLTDFVIKLNKGSNLDDPADLGRLSRTAVLGFYRDGVIDRRTATRLLVEAGYSAAASDLYLDSEDIEEQRQERKAASDLVIAQVSTGVLTVEQGRDRLYTLKLEPFEVQRALTALVRAAEGRTQLPSKADGLLMWRDGVINEAEYRDLLGRLGYPVRWVNAYVELEGRKRLGD